MKHSTIVTTFFYMAILRCSQGRFDIVGVIAPAGQTDWGDWGNWEYCPDGKYVNG